MARTSVSWRHACSVHHECGSGYQLSSLADTLGASDRFNLDRPKEAQNLKALALWVLLRVRERLTSEQLSGKQTALEAS